MADYSDAYQQYRAAEARERREKAAPEEQQGEPVCARCGHHRLGTVCVEDCGCSCTEPAPPSSEEAEAHKGERYEARQSDPNNPGMWAYRALGDRFWTPHFVPPAIEAAIRSPLEERVHTLEEDILAMLDGPSIDEWMSRAKALEERIRELETIAFHTDGVVHAATERIQELEEERDRLREALGRMLSGAIATDHDGTEWCMECWSRLSEAHDADCDTDLSLRTLAETATQEGGETE